MDLSLKDNEHPRNRISVLIIVSIFLLTLTSLLLFPIREIGGDPLPLEVKFTQAVQASPILWMPYLMALISLWGYIPWSTLVVAGCAWFLARRVNLWTGLYFLAVAAAQGVINSILKNLIERPRPIEPLARVALPSDGYSFPSGHVMFYMTCFGFLIYLILRYNKHTIWRYINLAILAVLLLLVGPSRIYLGAHWLADVIAGYLVGLLLLVWAIAMFETPTLKISPEWAD